MEYYEDKKILLSLFSRPTHINNNPSPKSYPLDYAIELVGLLKMEGFFTIQIGVESEPEINCNQRLNSPSIPNLINLIKDSYLFVCCDNFLHHAAHFYKKRGIVIFSQSNPQIFGYKDNINLVKNSNYLRKDKKQFEYWEQTPYIKDAFVAPVDIIEAIRTNYKS